MQTHSWCYITQMMPPSQLDVDDLPKGSAHLQRQLVRPVSAGNRTPHSHNSDSAGMDSSALDTSCRQDTMPRL